MFCRYTRFKKAKDVSNYSEKDLSEIFGKKEAAPVAPAKAVSVSETEATILTTTSNVSMKDYFARKLSQGNKLISLLNRYLFRERAGGKPVSQFQAASGKFALSSPFLFLRFFMLGRGFTENQQESYYNASMAAATSGKRGLGFGGGGWGSVDQRTLKEAFAPGSLATPKTTLCFVSSLSKTVNDNICANVDDAESIAPKKSKKSKKSKPEAKESLPEKEAVQSNKKKRKMDAEIPPISSSILPETEVLRKKKRKHKSNSEVPVTVPTIEASDSGEKEKVKKKKKLAFLETVELAVSEDIVADVSANLSTPTKKKKKNKKNHS
jgi:hypothetical protein